MKPVENDPDCIEKIEFLQEWFGYCLIPETNQEKMVWMVGSGANGKSVILGILSAIVGKENVSNIMITDLNRASHAYRV